jgi:hypothetical protein
MALIVFFRGINVGGYRAFRPSVLAKELGIYDAVNVGAAGTLVIRKPGSREKVLAELRRKLPFEATIAFCDGSDLIRLEMNNPFGTESTARRCCSICKHPVGGWTPKSFSSYCSSRRWGVACADHWLEESSRVWGVPPPHENNWLSRPDRQALWGAGDNAQLEHNTLSATDSEIPRAAQVDRRRQIWGISI